MFFIIGVKHQSIVLCLIPWDSWLIVLLIGTRGLKGRFFFEGWWYPPQNSYKPSQELWEATMQRRTISVQRLARYRQTNILCYFIIRISEILNIKQLGWMENKIKQMNKECPSILELCRRVKVCMWLVRMVQLKLEK